MGFGTVNTGYPVRINEPNGVAGVGDDGKIPEFLLRYSGDGFVEMAESILVTSRKGNTLYSLIVADFSGTSNT